ncbi:hypothetical protein TNIN_111021 [Trichonephila inaurata madagascariensis]|uniref:Uncharacterized protein n=1 Tax=Trichonephila inaurata madagascariensis TaxID=2747483 RepID=A0A8X6XCQ2_9ARAC|nr:hypothetical protein TNIN_111021 [Trichonephila inaurata madagascariensis]
MDFLKRWSPTLDKVHIFIQPCLLISRLIGDSSGVLNVLRYIALDVFVALVGESVVSDPWLLGSEDSSIAQCKLFASERKCISNGMQENLSKGGNLTSIKLNFNNALKKGNNVSTYATIS